jgi:hypothetical protein
VSSWFGGRSLRAASALLAAFAVTAAGAAAEPPPAQTASCHATGGLPDPKCTPGRRNAAVTTKTTKKTICVKGWTRTVRPRTSITNPIKVKQEIAYGIPAPHPKPFRDEELDHLIPLALGGNPLATSNLWPQPADGVLGYHRKDRLERALQKMVCDGKVGLASAQRAIAADWITAYKRFIGVLPAVSPAKVETLVAAPTLGATRAGGPFGGVDLNDGGELALKAPVPDSQLPAKGAFLGNVVEGPHIGRVYVAGGADRSIEGVVLLPLEVKGVTSVGSYDGSLNVDPAAKPPTPIKVTVKVTDAWWWAVAAVLLGALLAFLPQAWLRRWRPESKLHDRHESLIDRYRDAEASFRREFPRYANPRRDAAPDQGAQPTQPAENSGSAGPFTPPRPGAVEAYADQLDAAIRNYAKSTYYFDTSSDSYKKVLASLALAEHDADFFGAADGFGHAIGELEHALEDLARELRSSPADRGPAVALSAAAVLRGAELKVGEATSRAATARGFSQLLADWREMARRLQRSQVWSLALRAFADREPGEMSNEDKALLGYAEAKEGEVFNELLDAEDAASLARLGTSSDLDTIYSALAYLGGRYGIWVPPSGVLETSEADPRIGRARLFLEQLGLHPRWSEALSRSDSLLLLRRARTESLREAQVRHDVPSWIEQAASLVVAPARAVAFHNTLRALLDAFVLLLALAVGVVTALATFYFGKVFGTTEDYLTVIVIGTAAQLLVKGVGDVLIQLRGDDGAPEAVHDPAGAKTLPTGQT